eukprot:gene13668-biopygen3531
MGVLHQEGYQAIPARPPAQAPGAPPGQPREGAPRKCRTDAWGGQWPRISTVSFNSGSHGLPCCPLNRKKMHPPRARSAHNVSFFFYTILASFPS